MSHEVDVWWRFLTVSGREQHVWLSCKDWRRRVDNGRLWEFHAKLEDVRPQPHGVFVVRTGVQAAGLSVAQRHGITVWELRKPTEADWVGRARTIVLHFRMAFPQFRGDAFELAPGETDEPDLGRVRTDAELFRDEAGNRLSVADLRGRAFNPPGFDEMDWVRVEQRFQPPLTLIDCENAVHVSKYTVETAQTVADEEIRIDGDEVVGYIVKDALTGGTSILSHDLDVRRGGDGGDAMLRVIGDPEPH